MDRDTRGGGADSRNAGAYGDTQTGRDRQTGLVKKRGERWRRTNNKKKIGKERERQCILFTCSFSLRPPYY